MHISSNSILKQYLTNGCTKWEIPGPWNIASSTEHVCISTPRAGIAFAAAQDAAAPDVFAAPEEFSAPQGEPDSCSPWAPRPLYSCHHPCPAAQRGFTAPVQLQQI